MSASLTGEAVLQSYAERNSPFHEDHSQIELGERNEHGRDFNRENVHNRSLGSLAVLASLMRVEYGTWNGDKACLMCLRFQFQKGNHNTFRFERVNITVRLKSRVSRNPDDDPAVEDYGPKMLQSAGTDEARASYWAVRLCVKAAVGPVEIGPELERGGKVKSTRHYATEVMSDDHRERGHKKPNCVKYWLKEDAVRADGVPLELLAAIVFRYHGESQATIAISASLMFDVLAQPWTKDDPILLKEGVDFGPSIRLGAQTVDFATLTQDEWRQMVTPDLASRESSLAHARVP